MFAPPSKRRGGPCGPRGGPGGGRSRGPELPPPARPRAVVGRPRRSPTPARRPSRLYERTWTPQVCRTGALTRAGPGGLRPPARHQRVQPSFGAPRLRSPGPAGLDPPKARSSTARCPVPTRPSPRGASGGFTDTHDRGSAQQCARFPRLSPVWKGRPRSLPETETDGNQPNDAFLEVFSLLINTEL